MSIIFSLVLLLLFLMPFERFGSLRHHDHLLAGHPRSYRRAH